MSKKVYLEFDGASKGNPGKAGAGAVIKSEDGSVLARVREGMGTDTNNAAEYRALNRGMQTALEMGYDRIHVKGDSQLVYKQVQGEWKTRNENMSRYCDEARGLKSQFKSFDMEHVPRGSNRDADAEANRAANLPGNEPFASVVFPVYDSVKFNDLIRGRVAAGLVGDITTSLIVDSRC